MTCIILPLLYFKDHFIKDQSSFPYINEFPLVHPFCPMVNHSQSNESPNNPDIEIKSRIFLYKSNLPKLPNSHTRSYHDGLDSSCLGTLICWTRGRTPPLLLLLRPVYLICEWFWCGISSATGLLQRS